MLTYTLGKILLYPYRLEVHHRPKLLFGADVDVFMNSGKLRVGIYYQKKVS